MRYHLKKKLLSSTFWSEYFKQLATKICLENTFPMMYNTYGVNMKMFSSKKLLSSRMSEKPAKFDQMKWPSFDSMENLQTMATLHIHVFYMSVFIWIPAFQWYQSYRPEHSASIVKVWFPNFIPVKLQS